MKTIITLVVLLLLNTNGRTQNNKPLNLRSLLFSNNVSTDLTVEDLSSKSVFHYLSDTSQLRNKIAFPSASIGRGYWIRVSSIEYPKINVATQGILPDNGDISDKLQNLINSLPSNSCIFFPKGIYEIDKPINLVNNIALCGEINTIFSTDKPISSILTATGKQNIKIENIAFTKIDKPGIVALKSTTALNFGDCDNIYLYKNTIANFRLGINFKKSRDIYLSLNVVTHTFLSGIRFNKNGDSLTDGCQNIFLCNNYCADNVIENLTGGNGGIFFGDDGGLAPHRNIYAYHNTCIDENRMCLACDGKAYNVRFIDNILIQREEAIGGEVIALGGGYGKDGMKNVWVENNRLQQSIYKKNAACLVIFSNVVNITITKNSFYGGPQGIFFHYPKNDSYLDSIYIFNNNFSNCNQGILLFKNPGVNLKYHTRIADIHDNNFVNCKSLIEYSTTGTDERFRFKGNFKNGEKPSF